MKTKIPIAIKAAIITPMDIHKTVCVELLPGDGPGAGPGAGPGDGDGPGDGAGPGPGDGAGPGDGPDGFHPVKQGSESVAGT